MKVWLIGPPRRSETVDRLKVHLRTLLVAKSLPPLEFRATVNARSKCGRPVSLLEPRVFNELYREVHRELVYLIDADETRIRCRPSDAPPALPLARTMRLTNALRYKALVASFGESTTLEEACKPLTRDLPPPPIQPDSLVHHPAILPFPAFDIGDDPDADLALNSEAGVHEFRKKWHSKGGLQDDNQVRWTLEPRNFHGRDTLSIRRMQLPAGLHWDVQPESGTRTLSTALEMWSMKPGQYLNVYPDMYVRATKASGRRTWPPHPQKRR